MRGETLALPRPQRIYRTEAIVLRRQDLGETDRVLTLYTPSRGKVRAIAKGIRKPTSRKAGHLELFTRVDVLIAVGRTFDIITQAQMLDAFQPLRTDLVRATYAAHFVELLDAFTGEEDISPEMYGLIVSGLTWLSITEDLQRTARYYELKLLEMAGYRPELFTCVVCGDKLQPVDQFYNVELGGVVCPKCGYERGSARSLSLKALKVLRYLQTRPFEVVEQVRLSAPVHRETERLLFQTLTYHLERRLKSASFLERLRREWKALPRSAGTADPGEELGDDEEATEVTSPD